MYWNLKTCMKCWKKPVQVSCLRKYACFCYIFDFQINIPHTYVISYNLSIISLNSLYDKNFFYFLAQNQDILGSLTEINAFQLRLKSIYLCLIWPWVFPDTATSIFWQNLVNLGECPHIRHFRFGHRRLGYLRVWYRTRSHRRRKPKMEMEIHLC